MPDEPSISVPESEQSGLWSRIKQILKRDVTDSFNSFQNDIDDAHADGRIDTEVRDMMDGVLEVAELQARDVMIPRSQMVVLERDMPVNEIIEYVIHVGHSRFPVIGDDKDEVVGILLAKDLLKFAAEQLNDDSEVRFDIRECLRNPIFVPESKRLNSLLKMFRSRRNHLAIVVDEYGGVAGLITIEDVLEQIVGDIDDEHDDVDEKHNILAQNDGRFTVQAKTEIDEFNEYFKCDLPSKTYDTIGGLVAQKAGKIPQQGEEVKLKPFHFKILRSDGRKIQLLEVNKINAA